MGALLEGGPLEMERRGCELEEHEDELVEVVERDAAGEVLEGVEDGAHPLLQAALGAGRETAHELPSYPHKYLKVSPARPGSTYVRKILRRK